MININDKNNPELYYNVEVGVNFCKSIPEKKLTKKVQFHAFWIGNFGRKQALPIKSFFATQDSENAQLNLWSTQDLSSNEYLAQFKDKINFRNWDAVEEAKGTVIENFLYLNSSDKRFWLDGDLFRLLILHKYGGVYFDMDIVLLRDFSPLLDQEFMYKWGTEKNMINGAIMHLEKESKLSIELLTELSKRQPQPETTVWGNDVYTAVHKNNKDLTVFPASFFNTEWQIKPEEFIKYGLYPTGILEPFKKCEQSQNLFEGVFSWHWHGRWKEPIEDGSKWQILEHKIEQILKEKLNYENR